MTADVIPFPDVSTAADTRPEDIPDRHGITHGGVLATILDEMPESVPADAVVWLSLSACTTEVRGRTVTFRWPEYPRHVLRVPLAVVRRNSRRMANVPPVPVVPHV